MEKNMEITIMGHTYLLGLQDSSRERSNTIILMVFGP